MPLPGLSKLVAPRAAATARGNRRGIQGAGFAVGLMLVAAGLGLALPHLTKEAGAVEGWLGAVLLVTGAWLLARSAHRLLRGVRRRWWVLLIPLMLLTTYLGVWTVGQGVAASLPAHPALGARTPDDLGLSARAVRLRTHDGVSLAAWWVPARNGAAVVLLHGAGDTRSDVLDQAAVLARAGYGVLMYDARGHGRSSGIGMDFGWYGERDTAAAVDYLARQPGVTDGRIGLLGLSMGGEVAVGAAGEDPRIRAVVAEGVTARVAADKVFLDHYGLRGRLQRGIDTVTYGVAALLSAAPAPGSLRASIRAAANRPHGPAFLLITAGNVPTEEVAAAYLRRSAPAAVEVWTVPGAGHIRGLPVDRTGWTQHVLAFLDNALTPDTDPDSAPGSAP